MDSEYQLFEQWLEKNPILDKDKSQKHSKNISKTTHRAFRKLSKKSDLSSSSSDLSSSNPSESPRTEKFYTEDSKLQEGWLKTEGIYDKDKEYKQQELWKYPPKNLSNVPIDAETDLHQLNVEQALGVAKRFIIQSHQQNYHVVKIIHGKGKHSSDGPKIKGALLKWCEQEGKVWIRFSKSANRRQGGLGATIFWLK